VRGVGVEAARARARTVETRRKRIAVTGGAGRAARVGVSIASRT